MSTRTRCRIGIAALIAVFLALSIPSFGGLTIHAARGALNSIRLHGAARAGANGKPPTLSWLHTDGVHILDSSGREVILRGFATVTNQSDGSPVTYTLNDYKRMRSLGADYQSIRITAYALFGLDTQETPAQYIQSLDTMVSLAKQVGMYTEFKMTFKYNPGFRGARAPEAWAAVWQNTNGAQDKIISQWQTLWNHYKNEPAVIGYDVMNEPEEGALQLPADQFESQYLNPFYQKAIDALQHVDKKHLVFFQPPFVASTLDYLPYTVPLKRPNIVYAGHYYPNLLNFIEKSDFSTQAYTPTLQHMISEAKLQHAPLLIEEFGSPVDLSQQNNSSYTSQVASLTNEAVALFNQNALGFTRVYYSDDNSAGATIGGTSVSWAVIAGTSGLGGQFRGYVTNALASPYPEVVGGSVSSFTFDATKRSFHMAYAPTYSIHKKQIQRYLLIFVPRSQHYAGGFRVKFKSGLAFTYTSSKGKASKLSWALRLIKAKSKTTSAQASRPSYSWDDNTQTFLYSANQSASSAGSETLDITTP